MKPRVVPLLVIGAVIALIVFSCVKANRVMREVHDNAVAGADRLTLEKAEAAAAARVARGEDPRTPEVPAPPDDPVRVVVRDGAGGPVAGADIAFHAAPATELAFDIGEARLLPGAETPAPAARGRTGKDGVAIVRGVPRGRWSVTASAPRAAIGFAALTDPPPGIPRAIIVRVVAGHGLHGRVFAPDGQPAPGTTVVVAPTALARPWPTLGASTRVRTAADGAWSVDGLVPGDHEIWTIGSSGNPRSAGIVRVPLVAEFDVHLVHGGVVTGRVVDADTGAPLRGVRVRCTDLEGDREDREHLGEATTDAEGRFEIATGLAVCSIDHVSIRRPGGGWTAAADVEALPLDTLADGQRLDVVLRSRHGVSIAGVVVDPDGAPVAGAKVRGWFQGRSLATDPPDAFTVADAAGTWRIPDLSTAWIHLVVSAPGHLDASESDWLWGDETRLDATLWPAPPLKLSGRVLDADGQPVASAELWTWDVSMDRESAPRRAGSTGPDGTFALAVERTLEYVILEARSPGLVSVRGSYDKDSAEIALELEHIASVRGRVLGPGDAPVAGARVALVGGDAAQECYILHWEAVRETVTASDGSFAFARDHDEHELLFAWSPDDGSVTNERLEPGDQQVDLRLAPRGAIDGRVVVADTGAPAAGVGVFTRNWTSVWTLLARTGADGAFRLEHAPGIGSTAWGLRVEGAGYETREVDAAPGDIRIEVRRVLPITGRVFRQDGTPVAGAEVSCPNAVDPRMVTTDAQGRFQLQAFVGEDVEIEVDLPGRSHVATSLRAAPGTRDLRVVLDTGRRIAGVVRDAEGSPVSNASIHVYSKDDASQSVGEVGTDAEGRFSIEGLDATLHGLNVHATGHLAASREVRPGGAPLEIELGAGLSIAGALFGPGGPIAGSEVVATSESLGAQVATTDAEGRFRIRGLAPGRYALLAQLHDNFTQEQETQADAGATDVVLRLVVRKDDE